MFVRLFLSVCVYRYTSVGVYMGESISVQEFTCLDLNVEKSRSVSVVGSWEANESLDSSTPPISSE